METTGFLWFQSDGFKFMALHVSGSGFPGHRASTLEIPSPYHTFQQSLPLLPKPGQSKQPPGRSLALMEGISSSKGAPHCWVIGEEAVAPGLARNKGGVAGWELPVHVPSCSLQPAANPPVLLVTNNPLSPTLHQLPEPSLRSNWVTLFLTKPRREGPHSLIWHARSY